MSKINPVVVLHYKTSKEEMKKYRKLDDISDGDFRKMQGYMKHHNLEFSRMAFRLRTRQFRCRANMPKLYGDVLWCHSCSSGPEDGPGAQLFQSFFPITVIATYRLNLPKGQFI